MGVSLREYARRRGVTEGAVRKAIKTGRVTPEPVLFSLNLDPLISYFFVIFTEALNEAQIYGRTDDRDFEGTRGRYSGQGAGHPYQPPIYALLWPIVIFRDGVFSPQIALAGRFLRRNPHSGRTAVARRSWKIRRSML